MLITEATTNIYLAYWKHFINCRNLTVGNITILTTRMRDIVNGWNSYWERYSDVAVVFLLSSIFKLKVARLLYPLQLRQYEPFTRNSETRASFKVTHLV